MQGEACIPGLLLYIFCSFKFQRDFVMAVIIFPLHLKNFAETPIFIEYSAVLIYNG